MLRFSTLRTCVRRRALPALLGLGLATALLAGCGGGSGGSSAGSGTLNLSLTDAPSCGFDAVNVTITKISVNQSSTATDTDPGWNDLVLSPALRVNLLTLSNGVLASLGQLPLAPGKYTQMRLLLATNDSSNPLANSVVPSGGSTELPLTTPSGQQTGLKMNVDIDIAANQLADFVLDFDACHSVVTAGASGRYLLKPVVTVTPHYISAAKGYVDPSLNPALTSVSLQQSGVVVKATAPDSSGMFLLQPVAPGTYDLVVTSPGHATAVVTGVVVSANTVTLLDSASTPLLLPAAASGTAAGTVTVTPAPASLDASVAVTQTLSMGDTVQIVSGPVDAVSGGYSDVLPVGAPVVAPFVAPSTPPVFSADNGPAGKYALTATYAGSTKTASPVVITTGATTTTLFSFP